jgi:hypothetical protein
VSWLGIVHSTLAPRSRSRDPLTHSTTTIAMESLLEELIVDNANCAQLDFLLGHVDQHRTNAPRRPHVVASTVRPRVERRVSDLRPVSVSRRPAQLRSVGLSGFFTTVRVEVVAHDRSSMIRFTRGREK